MLLVRVVPQVLANLCVGVGHDGDGGGGAAAAEAVSEAEWEATIGALVEGGAHAAALAHCAPVDAAVVQVLAGHAEIGRTVLDRYCVVQARALALVQNLLTCGGISAGDDAEFAVVLWQVCDFPSCDTRVLPASCPATIILCNHSSATSILCNHSSDVARSSYHSLGGRIPPSTFPFAFLDEVSTMISIARFPLLASVTKQCVV